MLDNARPLASYANVVYWSDLTTNPQYGLGDFATRWRRLTGEADAQTSSLCDFKKNVLLEDLDARDLSVEIAGGQSSEKEIGAVTSRVDALLKARTAHPVHSTAAAQADKALLGG